MTQPYNFSAGPAMLPKEVLLKIQEELIEYENSKASVMEISHRGVDFMEAAEKSEKDLRELLKIPDHYKVLFLQGGASAQFSMVPINLLRGGSKANYANTGHWSVKAIAEAKRYCEVNVCTDSTENNFTNIDDFQNWDIDEAASYLHYTPNETIAGLEFYYIPDVSMPIAADMSSTILSREIDVSKYGVIYAGAQKNIGPSGLTIVIVREDLVGDVVDGQPKLFDYATQVNNDSITNIGVVAKVEDFKSGNSSLDSNSYRVLEALKYPNIIFKSLNIEEVDGMLNIEGLIEFHGIERSIDVMVISTNIENTTKLFGEFTINLSDYSVDRPSLLLRKIDNQITIVFELVFS